MKINKTYFKEFLNIFIKTDESFISVEYLQSHYPELHEDPEFFFHYNYAINNNFIRNNMKGIGYINTDQIWWQNVELCLTEKGHEYLTPKDEPDFFQMYKKDLKQQLSGKLAATTLIALGAVLAFLLDYLVT